MPKMAIPLENRLIQNPFALTLCGINSKTDILRLFRLPYKKENPEQCAEWELSVSFGYEKKTFPSGFKFGIFTTKSAVYFLTICWVVWFLGIFLNMFYSPV
jgi:hypothetical protein